jgi:hypothetical protein
LIIEACFCGRQERCFGLIDIIKHSVKGDVRSKNNDINMEDNKENGACQLILKRVVK